MTTQKKEKPKKDPRNHLSFFKLLAFKSSDISAAWINLIMLNYLSIFASDTLGVQVHIVGILLLVSKIVDAITDVLAGKLIDNTHTKLGKGRPYEICILGMVLTSVFMFYAKPEWQYFAKLLWIFSMYTLCFAVFSTLRATGGNPYTIRAFSNNPVVLRKVASFGGIITMAGSIVMSVLFPRLLAHEALSEGLSAASYPSQAGWMKCVAIVMIAAAFVGIFRFIFVKEDPSIDANTDQKPVKWKEIGVLFKKNKYTWLYAIIMLCYNISTSLAVGSYYFKYIIGDVKAQGMLSVVSIVLLPLMFTFPKIMEKMGSMCKMIKYFCIIGVVGYLIVFFSGSFLPGVYLGYVLGAIPGLPVAYYGILFIMNICNYNESISLPRMDASSNILAGFATKFGGALGSYITGLVLMIGGYISSTETVTQSASALLSIRIDFALVPAILMIIMAIASTKFIGCEKAVAEWQEKKKTASAEKEAEASVETAA